VGLPKLVNSKLSKPLLFFDRQILVSKGGKAIMRYLMILILTVSVTIGCGEDNTEGAKLGMTREEVIDILGNPTSIELITRDREAFGYGNCTIYFENGIATKTECLNSTITIDDINQ
jgi:hypothetical protein